MNAVAVEDPRYPPKPPRSFVFFVVANLGGQYRQLAVAQNFSSGRPFCGADVVRAIARSVDVLSDSANRPAIAGELALAASAYAHDGLSPRRSELCVFNRCATSRYTYQDPSRNMPKFPFLSACLLLCMDENPGKFGVHAKPFSEPLGLVYDDKNLAYGMVVLDISDLDQIQYGIVTFFEKHVVCYRRYRPSGLSRPRQVPCRAEPVAGEVRERRPLSASEYMAKFSYSVDDIDTKNALSRLEKESLVVDVAALKPAWPEKEDEKDGSQVRRISQGNTARLPSPTGPRSLCEMVVVAFVDSLLESDVDCDFSATGELENTRAFCRMLRDQLQFHSQHLYRYPKVPELLSLAYSGEKHLNWAGLDNLSPEIIESALGSHRLKNAQSIGLCIDRLQGTPQQLIDVLSRANGRIKEFCFHQHPLRRSDEATIVLLELAAPPPDPDESLASPPATVFPGSRIMALGTYIHL